MTATSATTSATVTPPPTTARATVATSATTSAAAAANPRPNSLLGYGITRAVITNHFLLGLCGDRGTFEFAPRTQAIRSTRFGRIPDVLEHKRRIKSVPKGYRGRDLHSVHSLASVDLDSHAGLLACIDVIACYPGDYLAADLYRYMVQPHNYSCHVCNKAIKVCKCTAKQLGPQDPHAEHRATLKDGLAAQAADTYPVDYADLSFNMRLAIQQHHDKAWETIERLLFFTNAATTPAVVEAYDRLPPLIKSADELASAREQLVQRRVSTSADILRRELRLNLPNVDEGGKAKVREEIARLVGESIEDRNQLIATVAREQAALREIRAIKNQARVLVQPVEKESGGLLKRTRQPVAPLPLVVHRHAELAGLGDHLAALLRPFYRVCSQIEQPSARFAASQRQLLTFLLCTASRIATIGEVPDTNLVLRPILTDTPPRDNKQIREEVPSRAVFDLHPTIAAGRGVRIDTFAGDKYALDGGVGDCIRQLLDADEQGNAEFVAGNTDLCSLLANLEKAVNAFVGRWCMERDTISLLLYVVALSDPLQPPLPALRRVMEAVVNANWQTGLRLLFLARGAFDAALEVVTDAILASSSTSPGQAPSLSLLITTFNDAARNWTSYGLRNQAAWPVTLGGGGWTRDALLAVFNHKQLIDARVVRACFRRLTLGVPRANICTNIVRLMQTGFIQRLVGIGIYAHAVTADVNKAICEIMKLDCSDVNRIFASLFTPDAACRTPTPDLPAFAEVLPLLRALAYDKFNDAFAPRVLACTAATHANLVRAASSAGTPRSLSANALAALAATTAATTTADKSVKEEEGEEEEEKTPKETRAAAVATRAATYCNTSSPTASSIWLLRNYTLATAYGILLPLPTIYMTDRGTVATSTRNHADGSIHTTMLVYGANGRGDRSTDESHLLDAIASGASLDVILQIVMRMPATVTCVLSASDVITALHLRDTFVRQAATLAETDGITNAILPVSAAKPAADSGKIIDPVPTVLNHLFTRRVDTTFAFLVPRAKAVIHTLMLVRQRTARDAAAAAIKEEQGGGKQGALLPLIPMIPMELWLRIMHFYLVADSAVATGDMPYNLRRTYRVEILPDSMFSQPVVSSTIVGHHRDIYGPAGEPVAKAGQSWKLHRYSDDSSCFLGYNATDRTRIAADLVERDAN